MVDGGMNDKSSRRGESDLRHRIHQIPRIFGIGCNESYRKEEKCHLPDVYGNRPREVCGLGGRGRRHEKVHEREKWSCGIVGMVLNLQIQCGRFRKNFGIWRGDVPLCLIYHLVPMYPVPTSMHLGFSFGGGLC